MEPPLPDRADGQGRLAIPRSRHGVNVPASIGILAGAVPGTGNPPE